MIVVMIEDIVTYFSQHLCSVEMNTNFDPVGTAVPGEIPGENDWFQAIADISIECASIFGNFH